MPIVFTKAPIILIKCLIGIIFDKNLLTICSDLMILANVVSQKNVFEKLTFSIKQKLYSGELLISKYLAYKSLD